MNIYFAGGEIGPIYPDETVRKVNVLGVLLVISILFAIGYFTWRWYRNWRFYHPKR